jgi:hypothetical protein
VLLGVALALLPKDRTNRSIGEQLFISGKTASVHVTLIRFTEPVVGHACELYQRIGDIPSVLLRRAPGHRAEA